MTNAPDAIPGNVEVRPGSPLSPVILHVPHASTYIPVDVRTDIVLDAVALQRELLRMTDAFTDHVARRAQDQAQVAPTCYVNQLSRLVIDPERFTDGTEELDQVGMGAVYLRTSDGLVLRHPDLVRDARLISTLFMPYADALSALTRATVEEFGRAVIIDVHSYPRHPLPYELHADLRRPAICLGTDAVHTGEQVRAAARRAMAPMGEVLEDEPFIGTYVPMDCYLTDPRVQSVMIEIRRDLLMDEVTGEQHGEGIARVGDALAVLVDALTASD